MGSSNDIKRNYVISSIIEAVRSGEFQRGEKLTERALAERYNVSRTPVREAFRCLEEVGILRSEPHKCVRVESYSRSKITNLYAVREQLEGLAAYSAATQRTEEQLKTLRKLLEKADRYYENWLDGSGDIGMVADTNIEFHQLMAEMAHNEYLERMMRQIRENTSLLLSESLKYRDRATHTLREHWLIYYAVENGYADLAENAARQHIRNAYYNVLKKLKGELDDDTPGS